MTKTNHSMSPQTPACSAAIGPKQLQQNDIKKTQGVEMAKSKSRPQPD